MVERYGARVWAPARGKAAIARRAGVVTDPFKAGDELPGDLQAQPASIARGALAWTRSAIDRTSQAVVDGRGSPGGHCRQRAAPGPRQLRRYRTSGITRTHQCRALPCPAAAPRRASA